MTDSPLSDEPTLGEGLRRGLLSRAREGSGLLIFAGVGALALSLASWSVGDPSFSHATDAVPENWLGFPGAAAADLLMQVFGLASCLLLLPVLAWSFHLMAHRPLPARAPALVAWLAGGMAGAAMLSALPGLANWPLPGGLGGIVGDMIMGGAAQVVGLFVGGFAKTLLAIVFAGIAFGALWFSAGLSSQALIDVFARGGMGKPKPVGSDTDPAFLPEPEVGSASGPDHHDPDDPDRTDLTHADRDDRTGPLIGAALHAVWSAKAALARAIRGGQRRALSDDDMETLDPLDRIEPELSTGSTMATDMSAIDTRMDAHVSEGLDDDGQALEDDSVFDGDFEVEDDRIVAAPGAPKRRVQPSAGTPKTGKRIVREAQPSLLPEDEFQLPQLHLLNEPKVEKKDPSLSEDALEQNARLLEGVLEDFGVRGEIINVRPGPVVTLYELEPAPGTKSSRVIGLADDIARSMSAISARVAVIPGRNAIGIELPNAKRETVFLREMLASRDFESAKSRIALALGKTIGGEPVIADLSRMPHLLIAGTTGSGKSVAVNTMILSVLYRMTPDQCRLIMIDPKMLELSVYDGIPHLLSPVVTDPKKAVVALKWTVREMEDRYKKMSKLGVRNIDGFNARVAQAQKKGEVISRTVQTGFDRETGEAIYETEEMDLEPMPFIVIIIDEMADLMMVAGKEIEGAVQRLAQMARAAGIHVVMATQRPSVDVITGTIKANFPTRISFQVTSKIDSRTILGEQGAEQLLGQGDMLYMMGGGRIRRVHGPFVSDEEVEEIVAFLKEQGTPEYLDAITADDGEDDGGGAGGDFGADGLSNLAESNDLYDKAVAVVLRDKKASTSYIQRRLSIGYNRAASLIERMEQEGLISAANHAGKREILVPGDSAEVE
ncbi:MAG: DNA translocase FtsK [Pseudomonadota bacterium]